SVRVRYAMHVRPDTHTSSFFGTNKKLLELPEKKNIVPNYLGPCMQNTSHTSHASLGNKSSSRTDNILPIAPTMITAITIPILQQPIIVSEPSNSKEAQPQIQKQVVKQVPPVTGSAQILPVSAPLIEAVQELGRLAVFDCE